MDILKFGGVILSIQLKQNGYDDVLSIEHEDYSLAPIVGVSKSVELLSNLI